MRDVVGQLGPSDARPETLAEVVARAAHPDPEVRFSVACALPSIVHGERLDSTHLAVTTIMQLTSDEDVDVRNWATFGLGTLIEADGALVRRCLLARVDDADGETQTEAIAGLARRHAPEVVDHVRDALGADDVDRLMVVSAGVLGDPILAEPLARLAEWWDVDIDLLDDARRRCDPSRADRDAALVQSLIDAAESSHISINGFSELLPPDVGDPLVGSVDAGTDWVYDMNALIRRAGGSVDIAVQLIQHDRAKSMPKRQQRSRNTAAPC